MSVDISSRLNRLEVEIEHLKGIVIPKTLQDYVESQIHRVKPKSRDEIEIRLEKHESLKKSINTKLTVDDPQAILDDIRKE